MSLNYVLKIFRQANRRKGPDTNRERDSGTLYHVERGRYQCTSCGQDHPILPYRCSRCGRLLRKMVREKDLMDFYTELSKDLRPGRSCYRCKCGRRYKSKSAICLSCGKRTWKRRSLPIPNFDVVGPRRIRCNKCGRESNRRKRITLSAYCRHCGNRLVVTSVREKQTDGKKASPQKRRTGPRGLDHHLDEVPPILGDTNSMFTLDGEVEKKPLVNLKGDWFGEDEFDWDSK